MARPSVVLTVQRTEQVTPHLVRVYLGGPGFDGFTPNEFTDAYVKLAFGTEDEPTLRTYTVRRADTVNREIALDFVVHGDEGVAGRWAATVEPGAQIRVLGPGGAYRPNPDADWHLLAGDESAVPAIASALESLPEGARAQVFIEVAGPDDEIALPTAADAAITWIHRGGGAGEVGDDVAGDHAPLVAAVRGAEWWPGEPHVFIHGEAQAVMHGLRPYIRKERGVGAKSASISGYWRRGRTEEGFRVWKSELAAAEGQSPRGAARG